MKPLPLPAHITRSGDLCQAVAQWRYWNVDHARVVNALASWRNLWPECKVLRIYATDDHAGWARLSRVEVCDPRPSRPVRSQFDSCHWSSDGWAAGVVVFTRCQGAVSASWVRGLTVERFEDAGFPARLRDQFGIRDLDGMHYWLTHRTVDLYLWGGMLPDQSRAGEMAARYRSAGSDLTTVHFGSRPRFPDVEFPCDNPGIAGWPVGEFDPRENRTIRCEASAGRPIHCRESVATGGVMETGTPPMRVGVTGLRSEM